MLEEKNAPILSHKHDEYLGFLGTSQSISALLNDTSILESYVNYPDPQVLASPSFQFIWQHQQKDPELEAARQLHPAKYPIMNVGGVELIVYLSTPNAPWQIAIPDQLLDHMIQQYHQLLNHLGMTNLFASISLHHYHRNLKERIETLLGACEVSLHHKPLTQGYGHLPGRHVPLVPWDEVAVDLIWLWVIKIQNVPALIL